jgi:hypothetical protein
MIKPTSKIFKNQLNQTETKQRNTKWKCIENQSGQYKDLWLTKNCNNHQSPSTPQRQTAKQINIRNSTKPSNTIENGNA